MNEYVKRFKSSNRISHYLRAVQIITGKWMIETKSFKDNDSYVININFSIFETREKAENWLQERYEKA